MRLTFWKACLLGAGLLINTACTPFTITSTRPGNAPQLFTLVETSNRSALHDSALAKLSAQPWNQTITPITLHPDLINAGTPALAITLPNGRHIQFQLDEFKTINRTMRAWVGVRPSSYKQTNSPVSEISHDPLHWLTLVTDGEVFSGSLVVDGQPYRLTHLETGVHALIKLDETQYPRESPPFMHTSLLERAPSTETKPASKHSTIRLMLVTTKQSRAGTSDRTWRVYFENKVIETNMMLRNSLADISFEAAGVYHSNYDETGKRYDNILDDIASTKNSYGYAIRERRDQLRADVVIGIVKSDEYGGVAFVNPGKENAYSIYTVEGAFSHELGHAFGLHHSWKPGDAPTKPPHANGYQYLAKESWRTRMAYPCPSPYFCPWLPYFSNPRVTYKGVPMGTVEHNDAARRLNERREYIENFYPPGSTEPQEKHYAVAHFGNCNVRVESHGVSKEACGQPSADFGMSDFKADMEACLLNEADKKLACIASDRSGKFTVPDLDNLPAAPLPEGFTSTVYANSVKSHVKRISYQQIPPDGYFKVELFAEQKFAGDHTWACSLTLKSGQAVSISQTCPYSIKPRSAKVYNFNGGKLCFVGEGNNTVCLMGQTSENKIAIGDLDSNAGLPDTVTVTRTGTLAGNVQTLTFQ